MSEGPGPTPEYHPEGSVQVWLDEQNFVWTNEEDFNSQYVDDNIVSFSIQPDLLQLVNIDDQMLTLTYESGQQYSLQLGTIADVGTSAEKWFQPVASLIIPADASLAPMFSVRTTPNLWNLRRGLNILVQQLSEKRLQIASIVYGFTKMMEASANNNMGPIIDDLVNGQTGL